MDWDFFSRTAHVGNMSFFILIIFAMHGRSSYIFFGRWVDEIPKTSVKIWKWPQFVWSNGIGWICLTPWRQLGHEKDVKSISDKLKLPFHIPQFESYFCFQTSISYIKREKNIQFFISPVKFWFWRDVFLCLWYTTFLFWTWRIIILSPLFIVKWPVLVVRFSTFLLNIAVGTSVCHLEVVSTIWIWQLSVWWFEDI